MGHALHVVNASCIVLFGGGAKGRHLGDVHVGVPNRLGRMGAMEAEADAQEREQAVQAAAEKEGGEAVEDEESAEDGDEEGDAEDEKPGADFRDDADADADADALRRSTDAARGGFFPRWFSGDAGCVGGERRREREQLSRVHGSEARAHAPGGGGRDDEPVRVSRLEERRRAGRVVLVLDGSNRLSRVVRD